MTAETATFLTRPTSSGPGSDPDSGNSPDVAAEDSRVLPLSVPLSESGPRDAGEGLSEPLSSPVVSPVASPVVSPVPPLRARVRKRSISIAGHATSVSMEDPFWEALREIATARGCSVADLVRRVDAARSTGGPTEGKAAPPVNLSSALRVFILDAVRNP